MSRNGCAGSNIRRRCPAPTRITATPPSVPVSHTSRYAVAGATPLLRPLSNSLAGDRIHRVLGIVNGTTNYILTKMAEEGADYASVNPRPAEPEDVGGTLTVASFNVLNYFTTLDSRGADTPTELVRQTDKLVAALAAIDARAATCEAWGGQMNRFWASRSTGRT